jgi:hypothetical protein
MRCLGFKMPAEGVTTTVPHNFKVIEGLSDPSLMHQWRQAGRRAGSQTDISSLAVSSSTEISSEDIGSDDPQSPGAKSPSRSISSECAGPLKRPAAAAASGGSIKGVRPEAELVRLRIKA